MKLVPFFLPGFYHQNIHLDHQGQLLENRGLLIVDSGQVPWPTVPWGRGGEVIHMEAHFQ